MIKFFSRPTQSITGAALVIAGAGLVSRLIGLVRDRVFAHEFGSGAVVDVYQAAFRIPDLLYSLLIVGALTAGFMPLFTRLYHSDHPEKAWRLANNVLNICSSALILLAILGMIGARPLSILIAPGFTGEKRELVTIFLRIILLSPILLGISTIFGGILQSLRQFLLYSLAPIVYNLGIIFGAVVLVPLIGVSGLAWGVVSGALFHVLIQWYGVHTQGYHWQKICDFHDADTRELGKLMIPRTIGLAFSQLSLTILTILGSTLPGEGNIGALTFANNLQSVPLGLIGIPFALAVFPLLARMAGFESRSEFCAHLNITVRQILFLTIPFALLIMILSIQLIRVIYGTGAFDWQDTIATAEALQFFALGIIAQSLLPLLTRSFYALSDTHTPFILGAIAEVVTISSAVLLIHPHFNLISWWGGNGVAALAFTSSLGATLNMVLLIVYLHKKNRGLEMKKIGMLLSKLSVAAIIMGLVTQYMKTPIAGIVDMTRGWGILLQGLGAGIVGILTYLVLCWVLKVEELRQIITAFQKRWLKVKNVPGTIDEGTAL